ncbi:DsbA family protein [Actinomadura yumaensis]
MGPPPPGPYGAQGPQWAPAGPPPPKKGGAGLVIALVAGALVVVLAAVGGIVYAMSGGDDASDADAGPEVELRVGQIAGGAEARPEPDGSLTMVRPGVVRPVVDVYEDFACPHCGAFDRMHDPMLKQLAVAGRAKVVFHPMVVFGESVQPARDNAMRAAAALRCVGDGARWLAYQDAVYRHQPASLETKGYATADLVSYGAPVGLTGDDFAKCVESQRYAPKVAEVSRRYIAGGVQGTPSVRVDGRTLPTTDTGSADALRRAIEAAG